MMTWHDRHQCPVSDPLALFQRLRICLDWWEEYAPKLFVDMIRNGVEPKFEGTHLWVKEQKNVEKDICLA